MRPFGRIAHTHTHTRLCYGVPGEGIDTLGGFIVDCPVRLESAAEGCHTTILSRFSSRSARQEDLSSLTVVFQLLFDEPYPVVPT